MTGKAIVPAQADLPTTAQLGLFAALHQVLELELAVNGLRSRALVSAGDEKMQSARCRPRAPHPPHAGSAGGQRSGSISLGIALVAGKKRVPSPATGKMALRMRVMRDFSSYANRECVDAEKARARTRVQIRVEQN
jgi:hypothetical protein